MLGMTTMKASKSKPTTAPKRIYFFFIALFLSCILIYLYHDTQGLGLPLQSKNTPSSLFYELLYCTLGIYILKFILSLLIRYLQRRRYLYCGMTKIDTMTGEEFEEFLKAHFIRLGYQVESTPKTADYGADLLLTGKDGCLTVVQAKRYTGKVPVKAVQEVVSAKAYYQCDSCVVITNSYFTQNAIHLAETTETELWNRDRLQEMLFSDER